MVWPIQDLSLFRNHLSVTLGGRSKEVLVQRRGIAPNRSGVCVGTSVMFL